MIVGDENPADDPAGQPYLLSTQILLWYTATRLAAREDELGIHQLGLTDCADSVRAAIRYLWVPDIRFTSCDLRVLMDQPTEAISSHDPPRRRQDNWHAGPKWRRLPQGAMRTMAVVVIGVLGQHRPQLPASQDQHPVQHLPPNPCRPSAPRRRSPAAPAPAW